MAETTAVFPLGSRRPRRCNGTRMPPPNPSLAELASVLGEDNVRTLVRTFLRDFPAALGELDRGERTTRHRIVHNLRTNSRLMGAQRLSQRMAELEERLSDQAGGDVTVTVSVATVRTVAGATVSILWATLAAEEAGVLVVDATVYAWESTGRVY